MLPHDNMINYYLVTQYFLSLQIFYSSFHLEENVNNKNISSYLPNSTRVLPVAQPNFLSVSMLSSAHLPLASANPK